MLNHEYSILRCKNRKKVMFHHHKLKKLSTKDKPKWKMQVRYAVKAEMNGVKLTKFVSQDMWMKLDAPERNRLKSQRQQWSDLCCFW